MAVIDRFNQVCRHGSFYMFTKINFPGRGLPPHLCSIFLILLGLATSVRAELGVDWEQATGAAAFSGRYRHSSVVFNNKLWVIGGFGSNGGLKNDVWSSPDGVNWTQATGAAPFSARQGHTSVVFNNKIWVIGGDSGVGGGHKNDV